MLFNVFDVIFLFLMFLSILSFYFFMEVFLSGVSVLIDWEVSVFGGSTFFYSMIFDWMCLLFMVAVLFISSCVFKYSEEYMSHDFSKVRFGILVFLFVLSMVFLIVSPNFISVILGWDGLGLVSYCLVVYYMNYKSNAAGMITVLTNRLGDSGLIICVSLFLCYGSLEFISSFFDYSVLSLFIGLGCFLAAVTKSAQVPFSAWLPAAMAAPTPVSALVHSSTLVTAGVYLLIRFFPLLDDYVLFILFYLSTLTMFMAGVGALFEYDMKKVIALSTLSQLGLMMFVLSLGFYLFSYFHLLTHAMFKSLLFLCAGAFIHGSGGFQDIRYFGFVMGSFPYVSFLMVSSSLALCGFPYLAGFYSKDKILEVCMMGEFNLFCVVLLIISTLMTSVYSLRLIKGLCMSEYKVIYSNMMDFKVMVFPMGLLMVGAIVMGSMMSWFCIDAPYYNLSEFFKLLVLVLVFGGVSLGLVFSNFVGKGFIVHFFGSMWFLSYLSSYFWVGFYLKAGTFLQKFWDCGWNEFLGPQGLYRFIFSFSEGLIVPYNFKIYLVTFVLWGLLVCFMFF